MKTLLFALLLAIPATARADQPSCVIGFDDTWALSSYYNQARGTFGVETRWNRMTNQGEPCAPFANDDWVGCWAYRQKCSTSPYYVNWWPWGPNGHHHLSFSNTLLQNPLCGCDSRKDSFGAGVGYSLKNPPRCFSGGPCPAWEYEGRNGSSVGHLSSDVTYLWVEYYGDRRQHLFTWTTITVAPGSAPVQIWYIDKDGATWGWPNLGPGYWALDSVDIRAAWIFNADRYDPKGVAIINDLEIIPQY